MPVQTLEQLKARFETGDKPTATDFGNLLDTTFSIKAIAEEALDAADVGPATSTALGTVKTDTTAGTPVVYLKASVDTLLNLKESTANKGAANGYVPLDADGHVPAEYLVIDPDGLFGDVGQNVVLAGPASGGPGSVGFRPLAVADLPALAVLDDTVTADGTETALQDQLNALASQVLAITGASHWYDGPTGTLDYLFTALGAANGIATLDGSGKLPVGQLPDAVVGQVNYQGTWDAATNTPAIPAADSSNKGYYYVASSAVASSHGYPNVPAVDFQIGDWIISDGTEWDKVDNTDAVTQVFGRIGNILAVAGDYAASLISNDSSVSGTYVKDALQTLGTANTTTASGLSTHAALTAAHGATGAVVGTTNAQTLVSKTLTSPELTQQTLTDAATIAWDMSLGSHASVTLGGDRTLGTPSNAVQYGKVSLRVVQSTGGNTLAWDAAFKWGTAPVLQSGAGAVDQFEFVAWNGNYYPVGSSASVQAGGNASVSSVLTLPSTNNTAVTFAHGLGVRPTRVLLRWVARTAQHAYSVADELDFWSSFCASGGDFQPLTVIYDATNVTIIGRWSSNPPLMAYDKDGTFSQFTLADPDWGMIVRAWV